MSENQYNLKVEVAFTPLLYKGYSNPNSVVVVIDVLRATSAMCAAFEHGVEKIIPVASLEDAEKYKKQGLLVGAERNGEKLEAFDFGNSPYDYMSEKIKGQTIALTTTNGTQAIEMAKDAYKLAIGSFPNITALTNWLINEKKDVILLCSGWKNKFNLEDSMFAGAVCDNLAGTPYFTEFSDSALAARYLFQAATEDTHKFLRNSSHRKRLAKLNLKEDIKYSLSYDMTNIVPVYKNGFIVAEK